MIPVIILLAIALVALLIDWGAVMQFVGKLQSGSKSSKAKSSKPAAFDSAPGSGGMTTFERVAAQVAAQPTTKQMQVVQPPAQAVAQPVLNPEVADLLEKADVAFRKGELDAAEQLYLKVASKDPKCSKAYSRLGVIYLENGEEYADAEEAFKQALKFDKDNGYILNNLGLVHYHQDKFAEAVRNFEASVRIDEANANRHANLGKAYMAMRQYAKAESCFKKAMKLAPNELEYKDLMDEALEKKLAHKALVRR